MSRYADEIAQGLRELGHAVLPIEPHAWVARSPRLSYVNDQLGRARSTRDGDVLWSPYNFGPARPRLPHVVTVHDLIPLTHPEFYRGSISWLYGRLLPRVCQAARRVVTVSQESKQALIDLFGLGPESVDTIKHGTRVWESLESARPPPGIGSVDGPFVMHVGGLDPRKNQARMLQAVPALKRGGFRFVWVGVSRAGRGFVHEPGGAVPIAGVSDVGLAWLYAHAAVVLMPSFSEGWGLPVTEALTCGTPSVATEGVPAATEERAHCEFVDPNFAADDLVDAVERATKRRPTQEQVAALRARYSWARSTAEHARSLALAAGHL